MAVTPELSPFHEKVLQSAQDLTLNGELLGSFSARCGIGRSIGQWETYV